MMRPRLLWVVIAVMALGLTGCGKDPSSPDPGPAPTPAPFPVSPDSLVVLYRTALAERDTALYPALLGHGFTYRFSPLDTAAFGLATDFMTRTEALQAADNIFAGRQVEGPDGMMVPEVTAVRVFTFDLVDSWEDAAGDSEFPGTLVGRHALQIQLERPFGLPSMSIVGGLDVYARAVVRPDGHGGERTGYEIAGFVDPDTLLGHAAAAGEAEVFTWGMGFYTYLGNQPPVAALSVRSTGTFPAPGFELDAGASVDGDSGLHPEPFRWRAVADSAWTTWRHEPLKRFTYAVPGPVTVAVEVRDHWGRTALAEQAVTVSNAALLFPDSPDLLMTNYRTLWDNRVIGLIDDMLAEGHVTVPDSATAALYPDLEDTLGRVAEVAALQNLFGGQDVLDGSGQTIPGVDYLSFLTLEKQADWALAGPADLVPGAMRSTWRVSVFARRGGGDDLQADGLVEFFTTARDSLVDGIVRDYWQIAGEQDLGAAARVLAPVSWSGLKAMYRGTPQP